MNHYAVFYNMLKQQPHESSSVNEVVLRTPGKAGRFGGENTSVEKATIR